MWARLAPVKSTGLQYSESAAEPIFFICWQIYRNNPINALSYSCKILHFYNQRPKQYLSLSVKEWVKRVGNLPKDISSSEADLSIHHVISDVSLAADVDVTVEQRIFVLCHVWRRQYYVIWCWTDRYIQNSATHDILQHSCKYRSNSSWTLLLITNPAECRHHDYEHLLIWLALCGYCCQAKFLIFARVFEA